MQLVPVRAHAAEELAAAGETGALRADRNAWSAALVAGRPRIGRPGQSGWYDALEADHDQVRALLQETLDPSAAARAAATGTAVVARLTTFWHNRSRMVEGLGWLEAAARQPDGGDTVERALLHAAHATALALNQRMTEARPHIEAARAGFAAVPEDRRADAGQALAELAAAAWVGDDPALAAELAGAAALLGAGDPDVVLAARAVAAASAILRRDPGGADQAEAVLADATSAANSFAAFFSSMALGVDALCIGTPHAGLRRSAEALRHYLAMGGREIGDIWEQQANHHARAGQFAQAARSYGAAAAGSRRSGLPWPRHPHTSDLLALTRDRVNREAFAQAWADGERSAAAGPAADGAR